MRSLAYCRSGRAGRRQWQWYVLGWFFWCSLLLSAGPCGPDSAESCAVLGPVVLARRCATRGAGFSPDCAALPVEFPQVLFLDEVMVTATSAVVLCRSSAVAVHRWSSTSLFFAQLLFPMVQTIQLTTEFPVAVRGVLSRIFYVLVDSGR